MNRSRRSRRRADLADPVVMDDPVVDDDPEELAVPTLLVPRGVGTATFAELPAPLGSLPELLRPPALAGPDGTPLTPAVPAPAEPALGEPTALPLPADGPLARAASTSASATATLRERMYRTDEKHDGNDRCCR